MVSPRSVESLLNSPHINYSKHINSSRMFHEILEKVVSKLKAFKSS